jgi:hypothetical protein
MGMKRSAAGDRAVGAMLPAPFYSRYDDRRNCKQAAYRHDSPLELAVPLIRVGAKNQLDPIRPEHRCDKDRSKNDGKGGL